MRVFPWLASLVTAAACAACAAAPPAPARPAEASLAPGPAATTTTTPPVTTCLPAPPPAPPPVPSDAEITKLSHDLLDAYDHGDVAALEAGFAPEFVHFEGGKPTSRNDELDKVRKRKANAPTIATRAWAMESVRATADSAIFTGKAVEQPGQLAKLFATEFDILRDEVEDVPDGRWIARSWSGSSRRSADRAKPLPSAV